MTHTPYDFPSPGDKQKFAHVVDGTAGTYKITLTTTLNGVKAAKKRVEDLTTVETADIDFDDNAATVEAALDAAFGAGVFSVTGGPGDDGGTTPYEITYEGAGSVDLGLADVAVTGGGASVTLTQSQAPARSSRNITIDNPTGATQPRHQRARVYSDPNYSTEAG